MRETRLLYDKRSTNHSRPTLLDLESALFKLSQSVDCVYAVVDGLDESAADTRSELLECIKRLARPRIRFVLTSRTSFPDIERSFALRSQIDLVAATTDINLYLRHKVENSGSALADQSEGLISHVVKTITEQSQGM